MVRAKPGQRDAMMKLAEEKLGASRQRPHHPQGPLARVRRRHRRYADDRAMAVYLTRRHRAAARHRGARHLRPRGVQRQHAHQADRHAPRGRCPSHSTSCGTSWSRTGWSRRWAWSPGCVLALLLGYWLSTTFELPRLKLYYLLAGGGRAAGSSGLRGGAPARAARVAGLAGGGHAHRLNCRRRQDSQPAVMQGRTILVIDDNEAVRTALEVLLSLEGATVECVDSPRAGPRARGAGRRRPRHPGHELPPRGDLGRGGHRAVPRAPRGCSPTCR